jgi:REP element-mobilizing transposase RayT
MPNTYTQIYIQLVFAVQGRQSLLRDSFREELHKYMTGIITKRKQKLLAINSVKDHIHILVGLGTTITIADLVHDVKIASSKFIDNNKWLPGKFNWQDGYGAFSYSRSHMDNVIKYINNQQEHHKKKSFKEEYLEFLKKFEIDYNEKYLFEWIED